jgi:hypothetical protein
MEQAGMVGHLLSNRQLLCAIYRAKLSATYLEN